MDKDRAIDLNQDETEDTNDDEGLAPNPLSNGNKRIKDLFKSNGPPKQHMHLFSSRKADLRSSITSLLGRPVQSKLDKDLLLNVLLPDQKTSKR